MNKDQFIRKERIIIKTLNIINIIMGLIIITTNLVIFPLFYKWQPELWLTLIGILLIVISINSNYRKSKNKRN